MDTKRKEQLQRALVFLGLGLLFTLVDLVHLQTVCQ